MNQITQEALDFVNEAKEQFTKSDELTTYRNEEASFIALRGGFLDRNMTVYELGRPIGNFIEQLPSQHKVLIDYDEHKKLEGYKRIRGLAENELQRSRVLLDRKSDIDYNTGFANAMTLILNEMTKPRI